MSTRVRLTFMNSYYIWLHQEEMDKNWRETTKMYMNRTERFPIFSPKKALILTKEGKEYLYSDLQGEAYVLARLCLQA